VIRCSSFKKLIKLVILISVFELLVGYTDLLFIFNVENIHTREIEFLDIWLPDNKEKSFSTYLSHTLH
jgi:hypothetical protein